MLRAAYTSKPSSSRFPLAKEHAMQGKTVVITGATSGIGRSAAERLAEMGARIVFVAPRRREGRGDAGSIAGDQSRRRP